jgi:hypothetical protein
MADPHFRPLIAMLHRMEDEGWRVVELTETRPPVPDGKVCEGGVMAKKPGPHYVMLLVAAEPNEGMDHERAVEELMAIQMLEGIAKVEVLVPAPGRTLAELSQDALQVATLTKLSPLVGLLVTKRERMRLNKAMGESCCSIHGVPLAMKVEP